MARRADRIDAPAEGFALARDGVVLAHADPLGRWLEWRPGERAAGLA
jgi:hypothetical protein